MFVRTDSPQEMPIRLVTTLPHMADARAARKSVCKSRLSAVSEPGIRMS